MKGAQGCRECAYKKRAKSLQGALRSRNPWNDWQLKEISQSLDRIKILSGDLTVHDFALWKCDKCGKFYSQRIYCHLWDGDGCPSCGKENVWSSKFERKIYDYFSHYLEVVVTDRTIIKSPATNRLMEIDVYFPEYNLAVEVNGLYYYFIDYMNESSRYSSIGGKQNYHLMKTQACQDKGIQLIHLFEDDLRDKWDLCLNLIKSKLSMRGCDKFKRKVIGARKCEIRKVEGFREFFDNYHINGCGRGDCFGLFLNDKMLSAIQVRRTPANEDSTEGSFILDRYAVLFNYNVVGGIERLMKYVEKILNIKKWISYADITVSDGALYKRLGFELILTSKPDYRYVYKGKRVHKFNFRIKRFKDDEELLFQEGMTEQQLAELNKIPRIYDCGKMKFVKYV